MRETYFSVDIESDGPIPGPYSMLSLGAAAFNDEGRMLGTYKVNLLPLEEAKQDPATMKWWSSLPPEIWRQATADALPAYDAMRRFTRWVETFPKKRIFVAYPAGYDFTFVYWYLVKFTGSSPFGFSALDLKTLAMSLMKSTFSGVGKRVMSKRWPSGRRHTHDALDDAIEQGELFVNMLKELRG